jgi:hypothetical protein
MPRSASTTEASGVAPRVSDDVPFNASGHRCPEHIADLLAVLANPQRIGDLSSRRLDRLLRSARSARLLGTVAARVDALATPPALPALARRHLDAATIEARFRHHKLRFLLSSVTPLVSAVSPTCILLKGAAYAMQQLSIAAGRLPADVDLMVPRDRLDAVEAALVSAGWEFEKTDPHDQRYYRDWSHELPPMQCAGHALELDLHHAILPPHGRLCPDPALLFADSVSIEGSYFRALGPVDQLLHVAAHLFQDSDCTNRLRDLLDFDALLRNVFAGDRDTAGTADRIAARAAALDLLRPLAYAAAFAHAWCGTPGSEDLKQLAVGRLRGTQSALFVSLVRQSLGPPDPDRMPSIGRRASSFLLEARAAWLRMPVNLLALHAMSKGWRVFIDRVRGTKPAAV